MELGFEEVDKHTQMIRLEKIMDQIDKGGSSYVDSVKQMFNQTCDYYFDNLRPPTPSKMKGKDFLSKLQPLSYSSENLDRNNLKNSHTETSKSKQVSI